MRWIFGAMLVLVLGVVGCSETSGGGVSFEEATLSYSVLTSRTGLGTDLVDELRDSTLPTLEAAGAVVYGLWAAAAEHDENFTEISDSRVVVMLAWAEVETELLAAEFGALADVSTVQTRLWEPSLRGDERPPGPGFYVHRFEQYPTEDLDEALSLSESAWVTSEPTFENLVVGVWQELEVNDGLVWTVRIAWYEDLNHWYDSRNFARDPESFLKFAQRALLQVDDEPWSASLLER